MSESIPSESATKITTETFDGKAQAIKRCKSLKDCFDDANAYMLEPDSLRKHVSALLLLTPCVVQVREHDQEPDLSVVMIDDETVPVEDQMPGWIDHSYVYRGDDEEKVGENASDGTWPLRKVFDPGLEPKQLSLSLQVPHASSPRHTSVPVPLYPRDAFDQVAPHDTFVAKPLREVFGPGKSKPAYFDDELEDHELQGIAFC